jgi:hypothetical protein
MSTDIRVPKLPKPKKWSITFATDTPAGYGGKHDFNTRGELDRFKLRAAERIGKLSDHIIQETR